MSLPLPPVPATIYAAGVEVKSADLNAFEAFMEAIRVQYETSDVVSKLYTWKSYALAASQNFNLITDDLYGTTDAACLIDHISAATGMPDRMNCTGLQLTVQNAAVNAAVRLTRTDSSDISQFAWIDDLVCVMEFRMLMDTIGANGVDVHMGFHNDPHLNTLAFADGTAEEFAMFEKLSADTNWFATVGDAAAETRADTGTPPVANEFQTFRVEYHGVATPLGVTNSDATVLFFIDGVEESEQIGTNVPVGTDQLDFVIRARANGTGPAGDFKLKMGPVRFAYTTHLAP